jgi:hypothetical protein
MSNYRKPIPKSQLEISTGLQNATDVARGNPNAKLNPNEDETGVPFNRSEKLSFKGDTTKPLSIGLQDLDEAIFYYFNNVIKASVQQNGQYIKSPVIYGDAENWKSFQKDGYYRDKNGAIMLPLIVIKRDLLEKDRSVANKLDANSPHLYVSHQKTYNPKNAYSNFAALNNKIPVNQFIANVVPDYVTLTYSGIIQTYYMDQLNKIIESIEYASDSYWGDPNRYKFRAFIDSFTTTSELTPEKDRFAKGTFNIRLRGYIIPDVIQKDLNSIKKFNSKSKFIIQMESVSNSDIFDPNIRKLNDGRTRVEREIDGRINSIGEITPGREIQSSDPGAELRS